MPEDPLRAVDLDFQESFVCSLKDAKYDVAQTAKGPSTRLRGINPPVFREILDN